MFSYVMAVKYFTCLPQFDALCHFQFAIKTIFFNLWSYMPKNYDSIDINFSNSSQKSKGGYFYR